MQEQIKALRKIAMESYEEGGHWMVECWDTADYVEFIAECDRDNVNYEKTFCGLIKALHDRDEDIRGTVF